MDSAIDAAVKMAPAGGLAGGCLPPRNLRKSFASDCGRPMVPAARKSAMIPMPTAEELWFASQQRLARGEISVSQLSTRFHKYGDVFCA